MLDEATAGLNMLQGEGAEKNMLRWWHEMHAGGRQPHWRISCRGCICGTRKLQRPSRRPSLSHWAFLWRHHPRYSAILHHGPKRKNLDVHQLITVNQSVNRRTDIMQSFGLCLCKESREIFWCRMPLDGERSSPAGYWRSAAQCWTESLHLARPKQGWLLALWPACLQLLPPAR